MLPWSAFWEHNYFARAWPVFEQLFVNNFLRGGVSGLGFVNLAAGVSELSSLIHVRDRPDGSLEGPDSHDSESYANERAKS